MKKFILGAFIALIVFLTFAIILTPAKVVFSTVTNSIPGLSLNQVTGTLWSSEVAAVQYREHQLQNIRLTTNPFWLMFGTLDSHISINDTKLKLESELELSRSKYQVTDGSLEFDTSYIKELVKMPLEGLRGIVNVSLDEVSITQDKVIQELSGAGVWERAVIEYTNSNLELGRIEFTLSKVKGSNNAARIDITKNDGVLDVRGYIEVALDKQFNFSFNTTSNLPDNLKNWLTTWGELKGNRIYIEWQGRLP